MTRQSDTKVDPVLRENFLRLEQVAMREQMCVHLPSLELGVPVKLIVDPPLFMPVIEDMPRPMQKAIIYTAFLDKRFTTVNFDGVRELFGYPAATDYMLMPPDVFTAHEIFKNCYPVLIEFRPDKELEKEEIAV